MNVSMSVLDRPLKGVSDSLQSVQVNAAVACDLVANCNGFFFTEKRTDYECKSYVEEARKLCTKFDLSLEFCPQRRPTRIPHKLKDDVLFSENISNSGQIEK